MNARMSLIFCAVLSFGCTDSDEKGTTDDAPDAFDSGSVATGTTDAGDEVGTQFVGDAPDGMSVEAVEPERYLGVWYEIASTPSPQQQNCAGTTAEYSSIDESTIRVINRCYLGTLDGALNEIEGSATFVDDTYARLMVDFGFSFEAPYHVVELDGAESDEPYQFAVVSSPGFALWVLSRTPQIDPELYDTLVERAAERGLPSDTLIATPQPE